MSESTYNRLIQDRESEKLIEQELLVLHATELISRWMEEQRISKAELARRIQKSRSYVTQLLSGSRNMTLRTFADLAFALERKVELRGARRDQAIAKQPPLPFLRPVATSKPAKPRSRKRVSESKTGSRHAAASRKKGSAGKRAGKARTV